MTWITAIGLTAIFVFALYLYKRFVKNDPNQVISSSQPYIGSTASFTPALPVLSVTAVNPTIKHGIASSLSVQYHGSSHTLPASGSVYRIPIRNPSRISTYYPPSANYRL